MIGDITVIVLIVASLLWDWKHNFRGLPFQVLAAIIMGGAVNAAVGINGSNTVPSLTAAIIELLLASLLYWRAWRREHAEPPAQHDAGDDADVAGRDA